VSYRKPIASVSDAELERRRDQIHRGLRRANTAAVVILLIVVGFCAAAILQGLRARRSAQDATLAQTRAEDQLWHSELSLARSSRLMGLAGRKDEALAAVTAAAAIRPSPLLRDEAVAALALTDIREPADQPPVRISQGELVAFGPDLKTYALGKTHGEVGVFTFSEQTKIANLRGPDSPVSELRFSPNGQLLGARFANGELAVWTLTNATRVFSWPCQPNLRDNATFDFSPDATTLVVADGANPVRFFNLTGGSARQLPFSGNVRWVRFAPQGDRLALAFSSNIVVWALAELRIVQTLPVPGEIVSLAWHPDGRRMAASFANGTDIWLWDTETTNHFALKGHLELVHQLSFDHKGDLLMSASWDGSTRLWRAGSGELASISRAGFGAQFSLDNTRIAYARENQGLGLWQLRPSSVYREVNLPLESARYITGFDFSPDSHTVAVANADGIHVYDLSSGKRLAFAPYQANLSVSFTADGKKLLLVGRDHISAWDIARDERQATLQPDTRLDFEPGLTLDGASVTRSGVPMLAVPSVDCVFLVNLNYPTNWWKLSGQGRLGGVNCAVLSPNTNWLATSYWRDGRTLVWDTSTSQLPRRIGSVGGFVAFSPDNRWLLVGSAHGYSLWQSGSWQRLWEIPRRSAGELVGRAAFSPDAQLIALCPEVNQVQLVQAATGRPLVSLPAPVPKNIGWLAFSPDGATLAASTFDRELQLWDLPQLHQELAVMGLDWNDAADASPPTEVASGGSRPFPRLRSGVSAFYLLAALGVVVAVFIGFYTLRYHQRMMLSYDEVETLAAQRNQQLELAETELHHSQKMKALGTLAAGIAHDFNNLLSVIRMGNNLLRRPNASPEDKAGSSAAVERAVEQGRKVVRSMLGYSRDPAETSTRYSVPEVVDDVVLLLSKQFLGGLTLTLELNRETPAVIGARGRLEQILLNLVVNAAEAMAGTGRLRIAVAELAAGKLNGHFVLRPRPSSRYVELLVADTGPGIDADLRDRIFEPFFSTKPRSAASGTGLGLSMVHSLATQEGMGIGVESTLGEGTAFTILIPIGVND
jgi:signal transduction histidine kinase